jgi:hypothetical protein
MKLTQVVRLSTSTSLETGYYETDEIGSHCVICTKVVSDILEGRLPARIKITYSDRMFITRGAYPARMYVDLDYNLCSFSGPVIQYLYSYSHREIVKNLFPGVLVKGIRTVYFWIEAVE